MNLRKPLTKIDPDRIKKALREGIDFIAKEQDINGSFPSVCGNMDLTNHTIPRHTTFAASLILSTLSKLKSLNELDLGLVIENIAKKGIEFLLDQRNVSGSWNYWQKNSEEASRTPYPDDLDDTFCALTALALHKKDILTGNVLASFTKILTQNEKAVGGPYYTWILDRKDKRSNTHDSWSDVDIAVNANIAYFLSFYDIKLPSITKLMEESIRKKKFQSLYYHSPYVIIYFISRSYDGPLCEDLKQYLLECQDQNGIWGDQLSTALAVSAIINLSKGKIDSGTKMERAISYLVETALKKDWPPLPLYIEENKKEKPFYTGAASMTAAFCTEALVKYAQASQSSEHHTPKIQEEAEAVKEKILLRVNDRFEKLHSRTLRNSLTDLVKRIVANDLGDQILLLPYFFSKSLRRRDEKISETTLIDLGTANLFGWMAYKIYDDLLDDEGDLLLLPAANLCLRELVRLYASIVPKAGLEIFDSLMDRLETANTWERKYCRVERSNKEKFKIPKRFPDYSDHSILAYKSLPHAFGPLVILLYLGHTSKSKGLQNTLSFFRHYLIARQLSDDAHDWLSDIERGFLNSVSTKLLKDHQGPAKKILLQRTFWNKTLDSVLELMNQHVASAKENARKIDPLENLEYLDSLLVPIEDSIKKTIFERTRAREFLASY